MFIDRAKIFIRSGDGGDGLVSFRREKFVPRGGPDGGDGGDGGSVILVADQKLTTLLDFTLHRKFIAKNGGVGGGKCCYGKKALDLIIKLPTGTIVKNSLTDEIIVDLTADGQTFVIAKGGKGGNGNARYATAINQAPRIYEEGTPGQEFHILLELKLIADAGIIGLPNAGKSTLLASVTRATPKIADYPFTTLEPYLGIADLGSYRQLVLADIPGLIEGAHAGKGLGFEFLRHVERTRFLIHIVDMAPIDGSDPVKNFQVINEELRQYSEELIKRPQIVAGNKMDLPEAAENLERFKKETGAQCYPISAATRQGLKELLEAAYTMRQSITDSAPAEPPQESSQESPKE